VPSRSSVSRRRKYRLKRPTLARERRASPPFVSRFRPSFFMLPFATLRASSTISPSKSSGLLQGGQVALFLKSGCGGELCGGVLGRAKAVPGLAALGFPVHLTRATQDFLALAPGAEAAAAVHFFADLPRPELKTKLIVQMGIAGQAALDAITAERRPVPGA